MLIVRQAIPLSMDIWQFSIHNTREERSHQYHELEKFYYEIRSMDELTLDDEVYPPWADPYLVFGDTIEVGDT